MKIVLVTPGILISLTISFYQYFTNGMEVKLAMRIGFGIIMLIGLYLKKFINNDTYLTSLKDSLPYFTVLFLLSDLAQVEWMILILATAIFITDFAGDG